MEGDLIPIVVFQLSYLIYVDTTVNSSIKFLRRESFTKESKMRKGTYSLDIA